jgi:hypothetical protein
MITFIVFSLLVLVLALTSPQVQPNLSQATLTFLSNIYVRSVLVFLVIFVSNRHIGASLIVALLFLAIQFALSQRQLMAAVQKEGFANYGTPLAQCGGYDASQARRVGTIFYPLNDNPVQQKLRNQGLSNVIEQPSGDFAF